MKHGITAGVYVHSEPERLQATLDSLAQHAPGCCVVLLPDHPDDPTRRFLSQLNRYPQYQSNGNAGMAAAFNRLAVSTDAAIVVLLESGSIVSASSMDRLVGALADSATGLSGPSTNLGWNAQCVPGAPASVAENTVLERFSRNLVSRYGTQTATLAPLYSLADFCYAVKREVIDSVGLADEEYGPGPCWEMDYNIRAARAGFQGVWVKAAYVHRRPLSARRVAAEREWLDRNKHRYQDKFCGLHLCGEKTDYRVHCRGDACPNFAPRPVAAKVYATDSSVPVSVSTRDLVSCIMPTANRRHFAAQAMEYFRRQDYPNRELIIVDDGADSIRDYISSDDRIHYVRTERTLSLGEKRNQACELARGEIIVHWDDDDWMSPHRISRQVAALKQSQADVCGMATLLFYESATDRAWRYTYGGRNRDWVAGGTLCYSKAFWKSNPFPTVTIGEDARFLWSGRTKKLLVIDDESLYVAMVHRRNTSPKRTTDPQWRSIGADVIHKLLGHDLTFYRAILSPSMPPSTPAAPLVSCIMPTRGRRAYVGNAIRYFLRQNYSSRELVIVDDGDDRVSDLIPDDTSVRYIPLAKRELLGQKRNLAVEAARGDYIVHWDDDDWYGPGRLSAQIRPVQAGDAEVTALAMRTVLSLPEFQFYRCRSELHARLHYRDICCGTIAYPKQLWRRYGPYPHVGCGEDVCFLAQFDSRARMTRLAQEDLFVCIRHQQNTWRMPLDWRHEPRGWEVTQAPDFIPAEDLAYYTQLDASENRAEVTR